ncbi:MAG: HEAT repeat domain-containing protein, partial [Planctomycetota bacterium]
MRITIITITICLFSALSLFAEPDWDKAKNEFQKDAQSSDEFSRSSVTSKLINNITPQVEPDATDLLIKQISNELARAKGGKKEEAVSLKVIDVCVGGLGKMTQDKAVKMILDNATKQSIEWRLRFYVIKSLGGINKPEVIKTLLDLINEKKPTPIAVSAFRSLSQLRNAEGLEPASKLLFSKTSWEIKLAILEYFRILESPDAFKYLKEVLKHRDE